MKAFYSLILLNNNIYDIIKKTALVILGSAMLGVSAHIYIPTLPIPFTMQSLTLHASSLAIRN